MILDLSLVAPAAVSGLWRWKHRPWGVVLPAIFLVKALAIMTGFIIVNYADWFAGRFPNQEVTIAFTVFYLLFIFFTGNYFFAFNKRKTLELQTT